MVSWENWRKRKCTTCGFAHKNLPKSTSGTNAPAILQCSPHSRKPQSLKEFVAVHPAPGATNTASCARIKGWDMPWYLLDSRHRFTTSTFSQCINVPCTAIYVLSERIGTSIYLTVNLPTNRWSTTVKVIDCNQGTKTTNKIWRNYKFHCHLGTGIYQLIQLLVYL